MRKLVISDEELEKILIQFYDKEYIEADDIAKQKYKDSYRTAESKSNAEIEKFGSLEKWYESGEGRLLNF